MNTVRIGPKTYTGPAGWDEVTPQRFRQVLNWQVALDGDPAGRFALLHAWYGIPYRMLDGLSDEQRVDLTALLDFLVERPERWLLPVLHVRGTHHRYVGPGDGLEQLSFGEFMHAQSSRIAYQNSSDPADLARLLAALYRPRVWGGERERFEMKQLESQAKRMARLPMPLKLGVLMNYEGCLDRFPANFPHLFAPSEGSGEGGTWLDTGINLARSTSALGTFAQIEQTNLYLVLTTLDAIMKDNEAAKKQAEQWKS